MKIKEISTHEYDTFALEHPLGSYQQSSNYALVMAENGFDYDCIGYINGNDNVVAAALILHKKIGTTHKYGYSPKGFLIDYKNKELLKNFTEDLKKHYKNKGFTFIKVNPEIAIGKISKNYEINYNQNQDIINTLENLGYKTLKRNLYFESMLPKFNAFINLNDYTLSKISKPTRNKINKGFRKGLEVEIGERDSIDKLYEFIKNKKESKLLYYKDYYNVFSKDNLIDVILVKINSEKYLTESKKYYEKELEHNSIISENLRINPSQKAINRKMQSDQILATYKEDMIEATKNSNKHNKDIYIAGAMIIKYNNRINIYVSGYDKNFKEFAPNYFLHHKIFEYYKKTHKIADLNGMTGDFSKDNPYHGLNRFKEGFNPSIYELIGEFDLIINTRNYQNLIKSGALVNEFNKNTLKKK